MLIKELFTKQIDRPINGGIKADQADQEGGSEIILGPAGAAAQPPL